MTLHYQWQMYWPNWWKLYPFYTKTLDKDFSIFVNWAGFGPFQIRWYSSCPKNPS